MMRVLVRADASALLGTGHVMRCLALAAELKSRGHQVVFVMRLLVGHITDQIQTAGFEVLTIADLSTSREDSQAGWIEMARTPDVQRQDAEDTLACLSHQAWDWLIVDHYALGLLWHQLLGGIAQKVMVIDDQADRRLQCDVLLNQNPGAQTSHYAGLIPSDCLLLMGPHYALLRPEFSEKADVSPKREQLLTARRILVSLGGADVQGISLKVLSAMADCGLRGPGVTVVTGVQNLHEQALGQRCRTLGYVCLKSTVKMADLMQQSHWAIGAGGVSMLERCTMGVPSITLVIAPNQKPGVEAAQAQSAVRMIDPQAPDFEGHLRRAIENLLTSPEHLAAMSKAALAICDGKGTPRVAKTLLEGALIFRAASIEDSPELHAWRNAAETRRYSGGGHIINLAHHQQWMQSVLENPRQRLWIASAAAGPIGVLRFDSSTCGADTIAEISVYRVPCQTGRGWGKALIARGIQEAQRIWPALVRIDARISDDNLASLQAFAACGFTTSTSRGMHQKNLERPSL